MKRHLIVVGVVILLLAIAFSGCNELDNSNGNGNTPSEYDRFVGSWGRNGNLKFTFFSDGDCYYIGFDGHWELEGNLCIITLPFDEGGRFVYRYYFSDNYTTLKMKEYFEDDYVAYTKQ
jgi:hypothetical protein